MVVIQSWSRALLTLRRFACVNLEEAPEGVRGGEAEEAGDLSSRDTWVLRHKFLHLCQPILVDQILERHASFEFDGMGQVALVNLKALCKDARIARSGEKQNVGDGIDEARACVGQLVIWLEGQDILYGYRW